MTIDISTLIFIIFSCTLVATSLLTAIIYDLDGKPISDLPWWAFVYIIGTLFTALGVAMNYGVVYATYTIAGMAMLSVVVYGIGRIALWVDDIIHRRN